MKSSKTLLSILLVAGLGCAAAAQETPAPTTGEESVSAEATADDPLVDVTKPGEHHEHLGRLAGDWDLTLRIWTSPDGEPVESAGSAEARWILDGRFLWTIYRAELFGEPFEAWLIEGYDNQAQQYVGTWRDTQGTYTLVYRGKCKLPPITEGETREETVPDGRYREMTAQLVDPVSGEKLSIRTELRIPEDGGFVQESFIDLSDEESIKNLELIGTRRDE